MLGVPMLLVFAYYYGTMVNGKSRALALVRKVVIAELIILALWVL